MTARHFFSATALGLLLYLLLVHRLGDREMWSSHEARAAQDTQYLLDGGDWRLPRLMDGRPDLQKPPLYYWLTALAAWCRGGVDEVAVRLPATAAALLTALALFILFRHHRQPQAGLLAALILLTMVHFTWMARVGRIDMPLTAATSWCVVSFLRGSTSMSPRFAWYFLGYLCVAAGLMLKGPIAVVLVGVVLLAFHFLSPPLCWGRIRVGGHGDVNPRDEEAEPARANLTPALRSLLWGLPLVAALVVPWAWWVNNATEGAFVQEFLVKHNFHRGLGGDEQLDAHDHPWWFYLARLWLDTAPWSVLLPAAAWWAWRRRREQSLAFVGLVWFGSILSCLSMLQYKRADYLLPAYPGLALLLGVAVECWFLRATQALRTWAIRSGLVTVAAIAVGWFAYVTWVLPTLEPQRALRPFAAVVRHYLPRPGQVILFRVDSHHLNWELGKTVERLWEWENLSWWASRPAPVYVVMPRKFAEQCIEQLQTGRLFPLTSTEELNHGEHETPLVLLVNEAGCEKMRALAGK